MQVSPLPPVKATASDTRTRSGLGAEVADPALLADDLQALRPRDGGRGDGTASGWNWFAGTNPN